MIQTNSVKTLTPNSDAGLFYHVQDGKFFPTKWLAIEHGYSTGLTDSEVVTKLRCCLHRDVSFDFYDWTKEPIESWDQILKNRMQWYRDTYEWIAIAYSGGADSQTILDTALKHRIKIDEIHIYKTKLDELPSEFHRHLNWEQEQVAIPTVKKTDLSPIGNPIISIWEFDDWGLLREGYTEKYVINHSSRTFEKYSTPLCHVAGQPHKKNGVIIRGSTHPTVLYDSDTDKYYTEIWDTDNFICGNQHENKLAFYTSPEAPWVHAKQCHMVKNYLRHHRITEVREARETKYRAIFQKLCRSRVLNMKSPFFDKRYHNIRRTEISKKSMVFARIMVDMYPDLYKDLLGINNSTIRGKHLYRFPVGTLMGRYYLE